MAIRPEVTPSTRAIRRARASLLIWLLGQPAEGTSGLFGAGVSGGFDARGQTLGKGAEVFDEDAAGVEVSFHDGGLEEVAQRATQTQPVETRQNACYRSAKSVKKSWRDASDEGRSL